MHTTTIPAGSLSETSPTYYVHHNGDWSGDVEIHVNTTNFDGSPDTCIFKGPFRLLEEIVGHKMRDATISELEEMTGRQMLEWTWGRE